MVLSGYHGRGGVVLLQVTEEPQGLSSLCLLQNGLSQFCIPLNFSRNKYHDFMPSKTVKNNKICNAKMQVGITADTHCCKRDIITFSVFFFS